jgi:hypothetical protein
LAHAVKPFLPLVILVCFCAVPVLVNLFVSSGLKDHRLPVFLAIWTPRPRRCAVTHLLPVVRRILQNVRFCWSYCARFNGIPKRCSRWTSPSHAVFIPSPTGGDTGQAGASSRSLSGTLEILFSQKPKWYLGTTTEKNDIWYHGGLQRDLCVPRLYPDTSR